MIIDLMKPMHQGRKARKQIVGDVSQAIKDWCGAPGDGYVLLPLEDTVTVLSRSVLETARLTRNLLDEPWKVHIRPDSYRNRNHQILQVWSEGKGDRIQHQLTWARRHSLPESFEGNRIRGVIWTSNPDGTLSKKSVVWLNRSSRIENKAPDLDGSHYKR